ncbi:hypothetical protein MMC25_006651 [Agyrium rufum]|nr:hypothetical protein [Agyrium rufum]
MSDTEMPPPPPPSDGLSGPSIATIVVSVVFPALSALVVGARIYARRMKAKELALDDWMILLALVVTIASCIPYIVGATIGGIGTHMYYVTEEQALRFGKILFALQFLYLSAVSVTKISILLFYKRIFTTRWFQITTNVMIGVVLAWSTSFIFATLFQIVPIKYNWEFPAEGQTYTEINEYTMYVVQMGLEVCLDIITLLIPIPVIWTLHLDKKNRQVLTAIFLLGGFVCIASVVRLYYLAKYLNPSYSATGDITYDITDIIIWSAIEPCVGIICACLPTLGPIFRTHSFESWFGGIRSYMRLGSSRKSSQSSASGSNDVSLQHSSEKLPVEKHRDLESGLSGFPVTGRNEAAVTAPNRTRQGSTAKTEWTTNGIVVDREVQVMNMEKPLPKMPAAR